MAKVPVKKRPVKPKPKAKAPVKKPVKKAVAKSKAKPKAKAAAPKKPRGRPKAIIDWKKVGVLFEAEATVAGICATIGIDPETLNRRCRLDLKMDLVAFRQAKKATGDDLLRKKQMDVALKGDRTMLIWLGKQRLDQTDRKEITHPDTVEQLVRAHALLVKDFETTEGRAPSLEEKELIAGMVYDLNGRRVDEKVFRKAIREFEIDATSDMVN